jgi:LysR family hydrogen peroxide-inducible transcriptional activator
MNLQQLEYIVAVDATRHFAKAAEACFVTQPTLSMMIQKLEAELDLILFDRSKQPIEPTKEGEVVISQAKIILKQAHQLKSFAMELKGEISGELKIGIIPTLAPYLLPWFLSGFSKKYPQLKIYIKELVTEEIIQELKRGNLDMALLATPVLQDQIVEEVLFYEEFLAYTSKGDRLSKKKYLMPDDIDTSKLWLLQEGHCLRNQIFQFCELTKSHLHGGNLNYEAGSIETLINLVDKQEGITIVPRLATITMSAAQQKRLVEFSNPKPVREISLISMKNYPRKKIRTTLFQYIKENIPDMDTIRNKNVLPIAEN